jgi:hypothetical protein
MYCQCAKTDLHQQPAGIRVLSGATGDYSSQLWAPLVHWQQQDYTLPATDILGVVEEHWEDPYQC